MVKRVKRRICIQGWISQVQAVQFSVCSTSSIAHSNLKIAQPQKGHAFFSSFYCLSHSSHKVPKVLRFVILLGGQDGATGRSKMYDAVPYGQ